MFIVEDDGGASMNQSELSANSFLGEIEMLPRTCTYDSDPVR